MMAGKFDASVESVTPDSLWDDRDRVFTQACVSQEIFDSLDSEDRLFVEEVVRRSLEYASTMVKDWLPESLSLKEDPSDPSRDKLVITLEIQHSDIEENRKARAYFYHTKAQKVLDQLRENEGVLDAKPDL